jgi:hypothetical protein
MMNTIAMMVGYLTIASVVLFLIGWALVVLVTDYDAIKYYKTENTFSIRVFGFGITTVTKGTEAYNIANSYRKTTGRTWFISVPAWVNEKVCNISGRVE